jgi:uncharacterized RDD family membrane protein YckC
MKPMKKPAIHRNRGTFSARETDRRRELEGIKLATFAQLAAGYSVDLLLAVAIWGPLEVGWRLFVLHEAHVHVVWDFHEAGNIIVLLFYHGLFNYFRNGQTPGKWLAGTRAVSLTGERLGPWQSAERALGYGAAVLEFGLGFLQFFWSDNRMCAQDRLAETIVIDVRKPRPSASGEGAS